MAQGKRTPEETKAKVTELKIGNPELSSYDIAEQLKGTEYKVSPETIQNIIKDLPQLSASEKGSKQIETLSSIIEGIEAITSDVVTTLRNKKDHTINDVKMLNEISKTNWERLRLLEGKATSNVNVIGDVLREIQGIE